MNNDRRNRLQEVRESLDDVISQIEEIKHDYLKGLTFHYVDDIRQVVDLALLKEKVANPLF